MIYNQFYKTAYTQQMMVFLSWIRICINFDTQKEHWKLYVIEEKSFSKWKTVLRENHVNRESKRLELTI